MCTVFSLMVYFLVLTFCSFNPFTPEFLCQENILIRNVARKKLEGSYSTVEKYGLG